MSPPRTRREPGPHSPAPAQIGARLTSSTTADGTTAPTAGDLLALYRWARRTNRPRLAAWAAEQGARLSVGLEVAS